MGVCIGVNQILGGTQGGEALNGLADTCVALSNKSAARAASAREDPINPPEPPVRYR
jgi:hypothetical protein